MKSSRKDKPITAYQPAMPDSCILIQALRNAKCYSHSVSKLDSIETHASWVILTGAHAYKIKKPVDLGFLDYSTLEKRRSACYEELYLNHRLAPELYIDVVPITGSVNTPHMNGVGDAIEYAVHMREFDQSCRLDHMLERGVLGMEDMDAAAKHLAAFHAAAPISDPSKHYGRARDIHRVVLDNFSAITPLLAGKQASRFTSLQTWSDSQYRKRRIEMNTRFNLGYVRECHGDLHLANLVKYRARILAFDRIEFSEALRWIDVMNDSAFLVMDLLFHKRTELAFRFLNSYLQVTGDYRGLSVLRYYLVYRALVRAKVALLQAGQAGDTTASAATKQDAYRHIELADSFIQPRQVQLILMHGLSGSGKTWLSDRLMTAMPAVRLRSDVERKRIHGQIIEAQSSDVPGEGLYSQSAAQRTYRELAELAEQVCRAGWTVIVDAAFLRIWQRRMFEDLAARLAIPCVILDCQASDTVLKQRVEQRRVEANDISDADAAVLQYQLRTAQPLEAHEREDSISIETHALMDLHPLVQQLRSKLDHISH